MKTMYVVAGLTAFLVAGIVFAQSESDYQGWMKSNGAAMASIQKNIAAKDGAGIAADAHTIEGNLKQAEAFWTKKGGAPDAVNFAKMGQMAAATLAKDAAGNMDAVAGDLKSLQGNCGGCHSLDYVPMNSPFLSPAAWDAEVTKMISAFGAPIGSADAKIIADYLKSNYGM